MMAVPDSTVTLRADSGEPLKEEAVRDMVVATAHAIAERQGVQVLDLATTDSAITVTIDTGRLEAVGFAAELRRLTGNWYAHKFGDAALWGEAPADTDDPADSAEPA